MTSVSLLSIFSGWTFVNTAHSLSAPAVQSQPELSPSLSSNAMPSYRCATNASLVAGGDRLPYSTTPISSNPSLLGRLKRSMSLSRLTKKRTRSRLSTDDESTNQDGTPTLDRPQWVPNACTRVFPISAAETFSDHWSEVFYLIRLWHFWHHISVTFLTLYTVTFEKVLARHRYAIQLLTNCNTCRHRHIQPLFGFPHLAWYRSCPLLVNLYSGCIKHVAW